MAEQGGDSEMEERIKGRESKTQEQEKLQDRRGGAAGKECRMTGRLRAPTESREHERV